MFASANANSSRTSCQLVTHILHRDLSRRGASDCSLHHHQQPPYLSNNKDIITTSVAASMRRPRGVDTAGMVGLVRFVNDATQHSVCDDTSVDVVRFLSQLPGYCVHWHENPLLVHSLGCPQRSLRCGTVSVRATVPGGVRSGDGDNYAIRWASQMCVTKSSAVQSKDRGLAFCGTTCLSRLQSGVDDTPSRQHFEAYYVERDCHACSQSRRQTTALQWLHRVIT